MNGLEKEYAGRLTVQKVNVLIAENEPILREYGFSSTPELYLFDDQGGLLAAWDDQATAEDLRVAIEEALSANDIP